jgi:trimethylamine:corrinoid methyltransferase-like protein
MCAWKERHKCRDYILEIASQIAATYLGLRHTFREKAVLAISIRVTAPLRFDLAVARLLRPTA